MSKLSRLKFDRFCVLNRPMLAAVLSAASGVAIALAGGIAGYSVARVESSHLMSEQAARHTTEILRVRDEYGAKASSTRDSVRQAAEGASEAADAVKQIAQTLGPSAKGQAVRAERAADKAEKAHKKVERIFTEPEPVPPKDAPEWLGGS